MIISDKQCGQPALLKIESVYSSVAVEATWVESPEDFVYILYTRRRALLAAFALILAALTFRTFK
jgi:hypothetical protein